jgi:hypothetical protein
MTVFWKKGGLATELLRNQWVGHGRRLQLSAVAYRISCQKIREYELRITKRCRSRPLDQTRIEKATALQSEKMCIEKERLKRSMNDSMKEEIRERVVTVCDAKTAVCISRTLWSQSRTSSRQARRISPGFRDHQARLLIRPRPVQRQQIGATNVAGNGNSLGPTLLSGIDFSAICQILTERGVAVLGDELVN